jgi:hypothetical protein
VQATNTRPRFEVVADDQGVCSHVGAALLGELSDRLGLTGELGRRANLGVRADAYDRGQVLRDLVVMLADGGDCVSDLASLRNQPELFGQVASTRPPGASWPRSCPPILVGSAGCGRRWPGSASAPGR